MTKKQAEASHSPPKAGRAKRRAAADDRVGGRSNEALAAKRPRGRPPKGASVEPLAPKVIATTRGRKLKKAADSMQPASENLSTNEVISTKASIVRRRRLSSSSSPSITNGTASEAPKYRSAERKASRGRSRRSSRSRHGGPARNASSRESSATQSERSHGKKRHIKSRRLARSRSSSSASSVRQEAREEASRWP
ncbi:hypothetical protein MTO96_050858 [Rhipicephalus appendiculatus]